MSKHGCLDPFCYQITYMLHVSLRSTATIQKLHSHTAHHWNTSWKNIMQVLQYLKHNVSLMYCSAPQTQHHHELRDIFFARMGLVLEETQKLWDRIHFQCGHPQTMYKHSRVMGFRYNFSNWCEYIIKIIYHCPCSLSEWKLRICRMYRN